MNEPVTIVVMPRDRFSSVAAAVGSIVENTAEPIELFVLDFGYTAAQKAAIASVCGPTRVQVVPCGRQIPLSAFREFLPRIRTRVFAWVDNDTYVQPGWLTLALARMASGARVVLPVTLEREGLDTDRRRLPLRNHISHAELREVTVDGVKYVFDYKPYRRAAPEEIPQGGHTVDFFELHAFVAETEVFRQLDLPPMVVREHIDLGIQLHRAGIPIWCEPGSIVHFDNIHERPDWSDLRFFFFRWSETLIDQSHALFEERWGYRFYNEQFMKNWAFRRKVYSVCRFAGLPGRPADLVARAANKLLRPAVPRKLAENPLSRSSRVLA